MCLLLSRLQFWCLPNKKETGVKSFPPSALNTQALLSVRCGCANEQAAVICITASRSSTQTMREERWGGGMHQWPCHESPHIGTDGSQTAGPMISIDSSVGLCVEEE